jgi:hypothetical protein
MREVREIATLAEPSSSLAEPPRVPLFKTTARLDAEPWRSSTEETPAVLTGRRERAEASTALDAPLATLLRR